LPEIASGGYGAVATPQERGVYLAAESPFKNEAKLA
jgi:hypothetical protein